MRAHVPLAVLLLALLAAAAPTAPERGPFAETRAWFVKAARDLRAAEVLRDADSGLAADVLFHA